MLGLITAMIADFTKPEKLLFTKRNLEIYEFCTIINYGTKFSLLIGCEKVKVYLGMLKSGDF